AAGHGRNRLADTALPAPPSELGDWPRRAAFQRETERLLGCVHDRVRPSFEPCSFGPCGRYLRSPPELSSSLGHFAGLREWGPRIRIAASRAQEAKDDSRLETGQRAVLHQDEGDRLCGALPLAALER